MKMGVQAYSSSHVPKRHEEETSMDPTTTFCPNMACPARGQTGQGNIGIHSCKEKRFICTACRKTFSAEWHSVSLQVFAASRLDAMYDVALQPQSPDFLRLGESHG